MEQSVNYFANLGAGFHFPKIGTVYKGVLVSDSNYVVVKKLDKMAREGAGEKEFKCDQPNSP